MNCTTEHTHRIYPPPPDYADARRAAQILANRKRLTIYILQAGNRLLCVTLPVQLRLYAHLPLVAKVSPEARHV